MNISSNLKGRAPAGHTSLGVVNAGVPTTLTSLEIKIGKFNSKSLENVENQALIKQTNSRNRVQEYSDPRFPYVFPLYFQPIFNQGAIK